MLRLMTGSDPADMVVGGEQRGGQKRKPFLLLTIAGAYLLSAFRGRRLSRGYLLARRKTQPSSGHLKMKRTHTSKKSLESPSPRKKPKVSPSDLNDVGNLSKVFMNGS